MNGSLRTLLLDLDDTLLDNPVHRFVPAYFEAISQFTSEWIPPRQMASRLQAGVKAMQASTGEGPTNAEVFASTFFGAFDQPRELIEGLVERYYQEVFPTLKKVTKTRPAARRLLDLAAERDLEVVIATNPVFPVGAVEERLDWAGIPVDEFDFKLVTTYETMHATKSHPSYYREILDRIDRPAHECLMVGDDWQWDVVSSAAAGLASFWINGGAPLPATAPEPVGYGDLDDLIAWLQAS